MNKSKTPHLLQSLYCWQLSADAMNFLAVALNWWQRPCCDVLSCKSQSAFNVRKVKAGTTNITQKLFIISLKFECFADMPCQRVTDVDGEQLKVHIQDTSDKVL